MSMALLVFVVVLIVIVGLLVAILERIPFIDATVKSIGVILLLLIALVLIVNRAGLL